MYINLQGGAAHMPEQFTQGNHGYYENYGNPQHYTGHQQHGQQHQQQNNQNEGIERAVKKYLPMVLGQIKRSCCTVM